MYRFVRGCHINYKTIDYDIGTMWCWNADTKMVHRSWAVIEILVKIEMLVKNRNFAGKSKFW